MWHITTWILSFKFYKSIKNWKIESWCLFSTIRNRQRVSWKLWDYLMAFKKMWYVLPSHSLNEFHSSTCTKSKDFSLVAKRKYRSNKYFIFNFIIHISYYNFMKIEYFHFRKNAIIQNNSKVVELMMPGSILICVSQMRSQKFKNTFMSDNILTHITWL